MFPLFINGAGKFFNLAPARAAIEKFVQPRVTEALSTLGQAKWVSVVSNYLKENTSSVVSIIASIGAAGIEVSQVLADNAKTASDKEELDLIKKISAPVTFGSSTEHVAKRANGSCEVDPRAYAAEATEYRVKFAEFAGILGVSIESARQFVDLSQSIFAEWDVYKAMISIK